MTDLDAFEISESHSSTAKGVAVDRVTQTDGSTRDVQIVKLAVGAKGAAVIAQNVPVADASPPFQPVSAGGKTLAPGAEAQLVAAATVDPDTGVAARVKIGINHRGDPSKQPGDPTDTSGPVWIGWGQAASGDVLGSEVGYWLERGGFSEEFFAGAVRVRNTGEVPVRVTWMEWGA